MKVRLGKVMLTPKGVYSSSATYSRLDLVIKDDCAYVSLAEDNTNHPLTDENYWMLLLDGAFTRRYYEQNGITVASIICNGNATIGGDLIINGSIISPDLQAKINALNASINNNSSRINALTTRVTALENNSGGGSGGGGGSVDPAVIAQLRSEINAKVDITYFNRLFQAYNGTSPVFPNDSNTTIDNIKALYDFWSAGSVTALGYNSGGSGGGGGGVEYLSLLSDVSLTSPSEGQALVYDATLGKWKNGSVIPSGSFATESWVTTQLSNYYTKSQTEQKIADAISQSGGFDPTKYYLKTETYSRQEVDNALNGYLPTTGGTITGNLTVSGSKLHLGQHTSLENYNGAIFSLPSKGVNTSWTLATTSDIPDISTLVTKDYFRTLFTPIDAQGQVIAATDTTTPIASIRANYDFWSTGAVSAYGTSSSGGGQGVQLGALLTSLNNSGLAAPTSSEIGKTIVWGDNGWGYDTAGGGGGGITLSDVRSDLQSTTPAYKINAAHIPDLSNTYLTPSAASATYAQKATTLAGYGITDAYTKTECDNKYVTIATQQTVTGEKTFNTYTYFKESIILDKQAQQYIQFNGGTNKVGFYGQGSDGSLYIYSQNPLNWYTDINGHVGLAVWGNGNVGVGALNPQYNLDVTGTIRATDSVIIGGGKIAWDSTNNSLYVQGADGSICHLYSLGGISSLGVGTGSGASISTLKVTTLNATNVNASSEIVTANIKPTQRGIIDLWTSDNSYYWEFNYQDYYDGTVYYALDCYNVGLYGENSKADNTWRITPEGFAEFSTVKCGGAQLLSNYVYINALVRLRANGSTVYLETRTSTSASWEIKETWN